MEKEGVPVRGEDEGDIEGSGILEALLQAVAYGVVVVFGLDEGHGDIGLIIENIVGPFGLAPGNQFAADDNPAFSEEDFLTNLGLDVPARLFKSGGDKFGADIPFAESLFIHLVNML
jgi:hypothetical protein